MLKYKFFRQFAAVLLCSLLCTRAYAQYATEFTFMETAPENVIKTMETNANKVFEEIKRAYDQNKPGLSLSLNNVTADAGKRIQTLWATSHFYCTETGIRARILKSKTGYQVRNIPVFFKQGNKPEDQYHDIVLEFTAGGKISDVYISIAQNDYTGIMAGAKEVADMRHRQMVVDVVENFRTAYNRKDMSFLNDIYSDDALIITGKVLKQQKRGDVPTALDRKKIAYSVLNKKQYLANLQKVFNSNSYINIKFDNIVVTRNEGHPNIYGVTLQQEWNSSGGYHDEGWLFLMIDYKDEDNPLIWVRTWQPLKDPNSGEDIHYNTEDIFGLGDFPVRK